MTDIKTDEMHFELLYFKAEETKVTAKVFFLLHIFFNVS